MRRTSITILGLMLLVGCISGKSSLQTEERRGDPDGDGKSNMVARVTKRHGSIILGESTDIQFREEMLALPDQGDEHLQVEVDGKSYFVGELAERQSNVRFFTLDQEQFIGKFAKVLALAAAARMVKGFVPINLVTGLSLESILAANEFKKCLDELRGKNRSLEPVAG